MKLIALLLISCNVFATNYYISRTGNDSNAGTTTSTGWLTISKLNSSWGLIAPGDAILFERGGSWYGSIAPTKSGTIGNPIVIGAYGTGAQPIVTGFTDVVSWTDIGGNLWEGTVSGSVVSTNLVVINGNMIPMGRFPNTGYNVISSPSTTSFVGAGLTGTPNFSGGEAVIRNYHWFLSRNVITSQSGGTINYTAASTNNYITPGYGFFIQNNINCLDTLNEWYYNGADFKITIFSNTSPTNVKVSTIDNLVNINKYNYITITNLNLIGANISAVSIGDLSGATNNKIINNCTIQFVGKNAIFGTNSDNCVITNCYIRDVQSSGIYLNSAGGYSSSAFVNTNTLKNIGFCDGMGGTGSNSGTGFENHHYEGIYIAGDKATISYNNLDSIGYNGIHNWYDSTKVTYNNVTNTCKVMDDGGGIYFWQKEGTTMRGREIAYNIVTNSLGAPLGVGGSGASAQGIYIDDNSTNIEIHHNTVKDCAGSTFYLHNTSGINTHNNLFYSGSASEFLVRSDNVALDRMRENRFDNNTLISTTSPMQVNMTTGYSDIDSMFTSMNNNYYYRTSPGTTFRIDTAYSNVTTGRSYSLSTWKAAYPIYDAASIQLTSGTIYYFGNPTNTTAFINTGYYNIDFAGASTPTITLPPHTSNVFFRGVELPVLNSIKTIYRFKSN